MLSFLRRNEILQSILAISQFYRSILKKQPPKLISGIYAKFFDFNKLLIDLCLLDHNTILNSDPNDQTLVDKATSPNS